MQFADTCSMREFSCEVVKQLPSVNIIWDSLSRTALQ